MGEVGFGRRNVLRKAGMTEVEVSERDRRTEASNG
jgi:hypothetical protein